MKITRIERTIVCVPFLPGILSPPEFEEYTPAYPGPLSARRQDVLRVHTDAGSTGIGMSPPYFGERENGPPELIGRDPLSFEPRSLGGGGYDIALLDLIGKAIEWPLCRIFGGRLQEKVLIDYWITRMGPEDSAAAAKKAAADGFHGIKMKRKWEDGNVVERVHAVHEAAAAPNCTLGSDLCGNFVHAHSLLAEPLVVDGYARVPEAPGLGVELDEETVARYALGSQSWP